jgi:hypothetical protein
LNHGGGGGGGGGGGDGGGGGGGDGGVIHTNIRLRAMIESTIESIFSLKLFALCIVLCMDSLQSAFQSNIRPPSLGWPPTQNIAL